MHRIDGTGATADNRFTEGDPSTGVEATVVTDDWLNGVQEELANTIENMGLTLSKGTWDQAWQAVEKIYGKTYNGDPNGNVAADVLRERCWDISGATPVLYLSSSADGTTAGTSWERLFDQISGTAQTDLARWADMQFETRADVKAYGVPTSPISVLIKSIEKIYHWNGSNLSTEITNQNGEWRYLPPDSDSSGGSGAWEAVQIVPAVATWNGADPGNSASNNDTAINQMVADISAYGGGSLLIPADVPYNLANISTNSDVNIYFADLGAWRINSVDFGAMDTAQGGHLHARAASSSGVCQLWMMPLGRPGVGDVAGDQPAALKVFHDEFDDNLGNYRDGGWTAEIIDGYNGMGVVLGNAKASGDFTPLSPEVALTLQGGKDAPVRVLQTHGNPAVAGNYFTGDYYTFADGEPIWRSGISVDQGQLIMVYGRIYEAQAAGTTGSTQPVHATYRRTVLTVDSTTGFDVGEYVKQQSGVSGEIDTIPDGTTLKLRAETDDAIEGGWTNEDTITGQTSGASTTISSQSTEDLDYDDPDRDPAIYKTGIPVDGRTVSDGGVDWRFLDDIKDSVPGRYPTEVKVVLGGDFDTSPVVGTEHRVQYRDFPVLHDELAPIDWLRLAGDVVLRQGIDPNEGYDYVERLPQLTDSFMRVIEAVKSRKTFNQSRASDPRNKSDGETTLDVTDSNVWRFNDSSDTNFTEFTGGASGQEITVRFNTGHTTLVHDSTKLELGGSNVTPAAGTARKFVRAQGAVWTLVQ